MPHAGMSRQQSGAALASHRTHPLASSLAVVDRAVSLLSFQVRDDSRAGDEPGGGWIECEHALADAGFFPRWRAEAARWLAEQHGLAVPEVVPGKTTGSHVLQLYLIIPSYLGALLFHSARRVPALVPRLLSFRLDSAVLKEVALRPGRFWCLPGDPDAGHPDAVPVPDEKALGAVLRDQVIAHATRFLAVYGGQLRIGRRMRWATVTDILDSGLLLAGRSFGSVRAGASDARLVLGPGDKPLTSASTICELTDDRGRHHWTRRRGSCCFLYALPGAERPCASCPRVGDAERARIFGTLSPS
ncbi:MAG TPA: (2Fe-2S)-binding protein [Pseudonocardiaceae bacterium]|nr:(2Fe-2S)-binding protein [Pseudonocardiaceae bacterium]